MSQGNSGTIGNTFCEQQYSGTAQCLLASLGCPAKLWTTLTPGIPALRKRRLWKRWGGERESAAFFELYQSAVRHSHRGPGWSLAGKEGGRKEGGVISVASNALRPATAAPQFADVVRKCRECPSRRTKWQKNALFR